MIYTIKQAPDEFAESSGLSKYGRSRMPGCVDTFQAALDSSGRFITGLTDEDVEKLSTPYNDYSNTSNFWKTFAVIIPADDVKSFNSSNPIEYVGYKMLVANGYVAPNKEALYEPQYSKSLYYSYSQDYEDAQEMSNVKKKDKAKSLLLEISDDKERMVLYGSYLEGIKYSSKFNEDTLYKMLRAYIDKGIKETQSFIDVFEKDIVELQSKIFIDKALKRRLIKKANIGRGKYAYQYGQVTLGDTIEEVYKNLTSPELALELKSIQDKLSE